ncbi:MAG: DsbA family protein [Candidatus Dasytiphilus stammeri]
MKITKYFILLGMFLINTMVIAAPFINGEDYITLNKPVFGLPPVVEFFSFFCPHCYQFELMFHQNEKLSTFKTFKYHVDISKGKILTQAWSISIALGIEKSAILPIFETVIRNNLMVSADDVAKVFNNLGISMRDYYYLWNSLSVRLLTFKQEQSAKSFPITSVPTIVVDGKYLIKNEAIKGSSIYKKLQQYSKIVNYLHKIP